PSRSQMPTAPLLPRPSHALIFAPRSAQFRSSEHELARRPHSRIVSENFTALGDDRSCDIELMHDAMFDGIICGGKGSFSHDVRSAHICSTSSTSGGVTSPRPAATMYDGAPPSALVVDDASPEDCAPAVSAASRTVAPIASPPTRATRPTPMPAPARPALGCDPFGCAPFG